MLPLIYSQNVDELFKNIEGIIKSEGEHLKWFVGAGGVHLLEKYPQEFMPIIIGSSVSQI